MIKKYLITGVGSGLGKYLYDNVKKAESFGLYRTNFNDIYNFGYDTIIHCAFNKQKSITDVYHYVEDNLFLTNKLLELGATKFIYISSIEVYNPVQTPYSTFKKYAEEIVLHYPNTLILRCPALIGEGMKENHFTKIIRGGEKITLSGESTFNYVWYDYLLKFFMGEQYYDLQGIYDFVTTGNVKLKDIKYHYGFDVEFGDFTYITPETFPNPIYTGKTSWQAIDDYLGGS